MFTLRCPIHRNYINGGIICELTQLFGENKNALFYGAEGHTGIDFATQGEWLFRKTGKGFVKEQRTEQEKDGRIPLVACHSGTLTAVLSDDKQGQGWGIYCTSEPIQEENKLVQYRTLYWHIETPWASLQRFWKVIEVIKNLRRTKVVTGSIIAIAGNNGLSTGPHLHLSLDKRVKNNFGWTSWERIDPMPYFDDTEIVYHMWYGGADEKSFDKGVEVTREEFNKRIEEIKKFQSQFYV